MQKPGHMQGSMTGQRANIAKLFEQGMYSFSAFLWPE
jgi:hypothetical protein